MFKKFENFADFMKAVPIKKPTRDKPVIFVICGRKGTFCYDENDVMSAEQDALTLGVPVEYRLVKYGNVCETLVPTTRGEIIFRLRNNEFYPDDEVLEPEEAKEEQEEPVKQVSGKTPMKLKAEKLKQKNLEKLNLS